MTAWRQIGRLVCLLCGKPGNAGCKLGLRLEQVSFTALGSAVVTCADRHNHGESVVRIVDLDGAAASAEREKGGGS